MKKIIIVISMIVFIGIGFILQAHWVRCYVTKNGIPTKLQKFYLDTGGLRTISFKDISIPANTDDEIGVSCNCKTGYEILRILIKRGVE